MSVFADLLKLGYFPKELPPPLTTAPFQRAIAANRPWLPVAFTDPRAKAALGCHNLARAGTLRRRLGLVNPVPFFQVADAISENWGEILAHCGRSQLSSTTPVHDSRGLRAVVPLGRLDDSEYKPRVRGAYRFLLKGDIARCYPSIYTHSIPWALHSKRVAKQNRGPALYGNEIDRAVRNGQDQQTNGLPIGPDTSLVIAEVILTDIDVKLVERHSSLRGVRRTDDYEISARSHSEARSYLDSLQEFLADYQLSLSSEKTRIVELPEPLRPEWMRSLRQFRFGR